jgi:hypothetical protein
MALGATPVTMSGGTLGGSTGFSSANLSGHGAISAPLANTGTFTASGGTLTVTGAVSGNGNVTVDPGATLALQNNLSAQDFILNGILNVDSSKTITLSGNFNNTSTTKWQPAGGINLVMTGSTFEVAGYDYGKVGTGFSNNFNLASLYLPDTADLQLVDLFNNGNQGGVHGTPEALYISSLSGASGAVLDLNHLWVYVMNGSTPVALADGIYNGVTVEGSPVPVPASVLLLGSGLLGLGLLGFRRREKKA